jgi:hypothetical protein
MHITREEGDTYAPCLGKGLELLDEPVALLLIKACGLVWFRMHEVKAYLMRLCCPMIALPRDKR